MDFEDLKRLYHKRKQNSKTPSYAFIKEIFNDIQDKYKDEIRQKGKNPQQSWNAWSGKNLQKLINYIIKDYLINKYSWVSVTDDDKLRSKHLNVILDKVKRNIIIFYNEHGVVPDADIIIFDKRNSNIIAVLSCKASLRERVAQAAYWKLKLLSNKNTENILYFLVSTDNDGDFVNTGNNISRNRIIVEFGEIDGAWILKDVPEGKKVKRFEKIFSELDKILDEWNK